MLQMQHNEMQHPQHGQPHGSEEQTSPPLPPTSTHPLYKTAPGAVQATNKSQFNYATSNTDPSKAGFYPTSSGAINKMPMGVPGSQQQSATNPWEREEREKEQEVRREQMRQWRDTQINELSNVARTPQQEEQLKTLILERDFERRAQMEDELDEEGDHQGGAGGGSVNDEKEAEMVMAPVIQPGQNVSAATIQPKSILKHNTNTLSSANNGDMGSGSSGSPQHSNLSSPMKQPPKTASFSDQVMTHRHLSFDGTDQMNNNSQVLSHLTKEMTHLTMGRDGTIDMQAQHLQMSQLRSGALVDDDRDLYPEYPPPPPERNSSYAFMSQQQQKLRTQQQQKQQMFENSMNNNNENGTAGSQYMNGGGSISPTTAMGDAVAGGYINHGGNNNFMIPPPANFNTNLVRGDNKRVSFHDADNNNGLMTSGGAEGYSQAGSGDLGKIREDPDVSSRTTACFYCMAINFRLIAEVYRRDHCHAGRADDANGCG